jgi:hypothetical protein
MAHELKGKKVAILATTGFEQSELEEPKKALEEAGARAIVVSPTKGQILGWRHADWGKHVPVDLQLDEADPSEFSRGASWRTVRPSRRPTRGLPTCGCWKRSARRRGRGDRSPWNRLVGAVIRRSTSSR